MRLMAFVLLAVLMLPNPAGAEPDAAAMAAMQSVIRQQVAAFARDDSDTAFSFASPTIQAKFGDADTFLSMVAASYRPVYRPRKLTFLEVREVDGKPVQRVLVEGPDGELVMALYPMILIDGQWRIDGCYLVRAPGQGT